MLNLKRPPFHSILDMRVVSKFLIQLSNFSLSFEYSLIYQNLVSKRNGYRTCIWWNIQKKLLCIFICNGYELTYVLLYYLYKNVNIKKRFLQKTSSCYHLIIYRFLLKFKTKRFWTFDHFQCSIETC